MPTDHSPVDALGPMRGCSDVYDVLEQIRLRPGAWLPGGSLQHLQSLLAGYRLALAVHAGSEPFAFWPEEDFTDWLRGHYGTESSLTWAAEIERRTPAGSTPVDEFFRLLDAFKADPARTPTPDDLRARRPDLPYTISTFVTLFWRRGLLDEAVQRLEDHGFRVVRIPADGWTSARHMHQGLAAALRFPSCYGHNLSALNDCLGDVALSGSYDDSPAGAGLVLSFTGYDRFAAACPEDAHSLLDVIAVLARRAAVGRRRFFALVHSDDPGIRFDPVGAMPVLWNGDEWLDSHRC
ncbi:barstar family protein [Streptomyces flavofungini]|uniref:barstar family protein n=1 Tax=Streptomyces flavofungini TaxID=68200 RepID=UPI0025B003B5|nr:barstar family protein [Streptomyces flavofungini]WJV50951.1 barstar family protein [Streptomyces flavofungini]